MKSTRRQRSGCYQWGHGGSCGVVAELVAHRGGVVAELVAHGGGGPESAPDQSSRRAGVTRVEGASVNTRAQRVTHRLWTALGDSAPAARCRTLAVVGQLVAEQVHE